MYARTASSVLVFAALLAPAMASADRLHVYGPQGSVRGRRVLAVLETEGGGCVPANGAIAFDAEEDGVTVTPGEVVGPCARWLDVEASPPRERVTLRARVGERETSVALPLGAREQLEVHAERRGRFVWLEVRGAPEGEEVTATAQVGDARVRFERASNGRLRARVPGGETVGVVARSGAMAGATALGPGRRTGEPQVMVLSSDLGIEAGGAPREAAFVVAVDARGRLTNTLPLAIQSERGRLRSLRWVERGVAAVAFSAPGDAETIDLRVGLGDRVLHESALPTVAQWPAAGALEAPETVASGADFTVRAEARSVDGVALEQTALHVRCDDGEPRAIPATCPGRLGPSSRVLTLVAYVDGRAVPLAVREVGVEPPRAIAQPARPVREAPPEVVVPAPRRPLGVVAVYARGGYDTWERAGGDVGARVLFELVPWLRLGVGFDYGLRSVSAMGQGAVESDLSGLRHRVLGAGAVELVFGDDFAAAVRLELAAGLARGAIALDGVDVSGDSPHLAARLFGGPRWRLDGFEIGVEGGVTVGSDLDRRAWGAAPVAGSLEVSGAFALP